MLTFTLLAWTYYSWEGAEEGPAPTVGDIVVSIILISLFYIFVVNKNN